MYKIEIETPTTNDTIYTENLNEVVFPHDLENATIEKMQTEHIPPPGINHFDPYNPNDMEAVLMWWLQFCDYTELLHTCVTPYNANNTIISAHKTPLRKTKNLIRTYENIYQYACAYQDLSYNGQVYFSTRMLHDILSLIGSELDPMDMCLDDWWNS